MCRTNACICDPCALVCGPYKGSMLILDEELKTHFRIRAASVSKQETTEPPLAPESPLAPEPDMAR